ncbi:MAG: class I SAM-dependent methyltransferase [Candidatus Thorarchaeota archaeon]
MTDAWSEIMKDASDGVSGEYYIERDDGRIETLKVSDYTLQFSEWSEVERIAMKHVKGRVLDVGCGTGRVALHLQNLGFSVVGVDLAPGAIEGCKKLGLKEAYVMSAERLEFPNSEFDTVILFGDNFGILGDREKIIDMLRTLHRITKPDGIILAASADVKITEDQEHLNYHKMNLSKGRPKGLVRIRVKYKGIIDDWSELWLAMPDEMESVAKEAGWKMRSKYQKGTPYVGILKKS